MNLPGPLPPAEQAHCRQTAALSELLAKLAGFPDYEVRTVTQSALVHDIGKTAIPVSILCKPGPLTAEECAIMRMHTAVGAHILIHTTVLCVQHLLWRYSTMSVLTAAVIWACVKVRSTPMRNWLR